MGSGKFWIDLGWLWVFDSDWARLLALAVVALMVIFMLGVGPVSDAFVKDRADKRRYELKKRELQQKIADRRKKGK